MSLVDEEDVVAAKVLPVPTGRGPFGPGSLLGPSWTSARPGPSGHSLTGNEYHPTSAATVDRTQEPQNWKQSFDHRRVLGLEGYGTSRATIVLSVALVTTSLPPPVRGRTTPRLLRLPVSRVVATRGPGYGRAVVVLGEESTVYVRGRPSVRGEGYISVLLGVCGGRKSVSLYAGCGRGGHGSPQVPGRRCDGHSLRSVWWPSTLFAGGTRGDLLSRSPHTPPMSVPSETFGCIRGCHQGRPLICPSRGPCSPVNRRPENLPYSPGEQVSREPPVRFWTGSWTPPRRP